jgi:hypothetical protein
LSLSNYAFGRGDFVFVVYYSAWLVFIILVDDGRPRKTHTYDDSVVVFRARDYEHAFERSLEMGRAQETEYMNQDGRQVRWAFVEVVKLKRIGRRVEGQEVSSLLDRRRSDSAIPYGKRFRPERSKPIHF